ncbi:MAG: DUF429 domain-containing protein [Chloroflexi bacterium]|nr:DUF429 domain-containing protein [Chloroflexota bacterium]
MSLRSTVLGIDAAWTPTGSTGLVLAESLGNQAGRVLRVARSYREFVAGGTSATAWSGSPIVGNTPLTDVLAAARDLTDTLPAVIALDIPLSPVPITRRRAADDLVSRNYGSRRAATHSPTDTRPGTVASYLFAALTQAGYHWQGVGSVADGPATSPLVFFETYPHAAIVELLGLSERLPYKVARASRYLPSASPAERRTYLAANLDLLRDRLAERLENLREVTPSATDLVAAGVRGRLKALEDALDAAVCAVVALDHLAGRAIAYGDSTSAIWLPQPAPLTGNESLGRPSPMRRAVPPVT